MRPSPTLLALSAAAAILIAVPTAAHAGENLQDVLLELERSAASGTAALTATDDGALKVGVRGRGLVPNPSPPRTLGESILADRAALSC